MTGIFCIGDGGSFLFNSRRVSSDQAVIKDILDIFVDQVIFVSPYSAKLFPENSGIYICDEPDLALDAKVCFMEKLPCSYSLADLDRVILYHWNRTYPADVLFPISDLRKCKKLVAQMEFSGNSHERILREIYE